jgi:hypothetical protein
VDRGFAEQQLKRRENTMDMQDRAAYFLIGAIVVLMLVLGCACPRCHAQKLEMQAVQPERIQEIKSAFGPEVGERILVLLGVPKATLATAAESLIEQATLESKEPAPPVSIDKETAARVFATDEESLLLAVRYQVLSDIVERGRIRGSVSKDCLDNATTVFAVYKAPPRFLRRLNLILELEGK